jgi:glycyl-tRNA synthetase beta chain
MVGEFPELQGVMGRYYAVAQKEDASVADAIRDHYKPQGPTDSVPTNPVAICVALADKLDTLVSMFTIGEKPTGSKDPFALRRSALGIIRIILENNIRLPLAAFLDAELFAFFIDRLKVQLKDQGIRHDVINAVVANGDDDLVRVVARAKAVQEFINTDDGINLLAGYKRAANILAIEERKDETTYHQEVTSSNLKDAEEKILCDTLNTIDMQVKDFVMAEKFVEAMRLFAELRTPVDRFFDKTMVNCEDRELRANRLRLLSFMRDTMIEVADFALIEGETKEQKKAA